MIDYKSNYNTKAKIQSNTVDCYVITTLKMTLLYFLKKRTLNIYKKYRMQFRIC